MLLGMTRLVFAADLIVLNYHDVVANPGNDRFAVSRSAFVAQMDYLQQNGYRPITLAELERIFNDHLPVPEKTVVLTFDDGLKSYREFVAPLLEIYQFPSIVSLVTAWLDGIDVPPEYLGKIMTWNDARQIAAMNRISVVSHTHNMHRGIPANSRGNQRGAATTREYFPLTQSFETEVQFRDRVRSDLALSLSRMQKELGRTTHAVAWPYGDYDEVVLREARALGINLHFVLSDSDNSDFAKGIIGRTLVVDRPDIDNFSKLLAHSPATVPRRFAEINLDAYEGKSEPEQEALLSDLLNRLAELHVNAVIIAPVSSDGRRAFFTTSACLTATDVLDRVVHQIRTRLNIRHVVLRFPAILHVKDERIFYTDMARLIRFNALLFPSGIKTAQLKMVRDVVSQHRPGINYGIVGDLRRSAEVDFLLVSATGLQDITMVNPARLWVAVSGVRDEPALREVVARLNAQGVLNYGVPVEWVLGDVKPRGMMDQAIRSGS